MKTITDPIGLYVHIPFCLKKCDYCDFCSFPSSVGLSRDAYINSLCAEIRSYEKGKIAVDSVFFGGGTPSILSGCEFKRITDAIYESFLVKSGAEFTLEANPKTLTEENLKAYLESGVNRVSLGLQTIHENELKKLGRVHSFDDFLSTYELVRRLGVKNVSIDLMYGIPEQTKASFGETLKRVIELSPEHISVYGLIIEDGTRLARHLSDYAIPTENEECDMYYLASDMLNENGYMHYEISNYAKQGFTCDHNLKYWRDMEYIGVGIAAYSYFNGKRFGNSRDFDAYVRDFSSSREFDEKIDTDENRFEFAMLALRLSEGFSLKEYKARFGIDFLKGKESLAKRLCEAGLLGIENDRIFLTEKGFYVSNSILSELL